MKVFPLAKKDSDLEQNSKTTHVFMPHNWWYSNNSIDIGFVLEKQQMSIPIKVSEALPKTPGWSIKNGDYRVKESTTDRHNYLYYRDLRIQIMKYLLYPTVIITILIVFMFLKLFVKV
jgi:hypothetical protein